ncbi:hypothetical protein DITRI_Ditri03aG0043700 [Diplodiscus trichospermus]
MMNAFWWDKVGSGSHSIHWKSWSRLCEQKHEGGLGFRKIHEFNLVLLGKQCWRLLTRPDSLVVRLFKARYFPSETFLEAKVGSNSSFIWRNILAGMDGLKVGLRRQIGNGMDTQVCYDPWLLDDANPYNEKDVMEKLQDIKLSLLILPNGEGWDVDLVTELFSSRDMALICSLPLSERNSDDVWYRALENKGH